MFHPSNLVIGGILETVWRSVHNLVIETNDEDCNLPTICRSLDTWICSESFQENRRLSLRTSAALISGVTKLYNTSICKLLEDVKSLDENIIYRKRRWSNNSITPSSYESSKTAATPEQARQDIIYDFDTSYSTRKRMKRNSGSGNHNNNSYSLDISSFESNSTNSRHSTLNETSLESFSEQNDRSSKEPQDSTAPVTQKSDQGVQTSPSMQRIETNGDSSDSTAPVTQKSDQGVQTSPSMLQIETNGDSSVSDFVDKDLPYAYILVHDNYRSRTPSKIILTSITSDVRNLN